MTQHLAIAETYLTLWNEEDDERRKHLLGKAWAETARYIDPLMQGEGRQGIAAMIEAARQKFPGYRFVLAGTPDGHGNFTRFHGVSFRLMETMSRAAPMSSAAMPMGELKMSSASSTVPQRKADDRRQVSPPSVPGRVSSPQIPHRPDAGQAHGTRWTRCRPGRGRHWHTWSRASPAPPTGRAGSASGPSDRGRAGRRSP